VCDGSIRNTLGKGNEVSVFANEIRFATDAKYDTTFIVSSSLSDDNAFFGFSSLLLQLLFVLVYATSRWRLQNHHCFQLVLLRQSNIPAPVV
jgi:hypothetical protein